MTDRLSLLRNFGANIDAAKQAFEAGRLDETRRIVDLYDGLFKQDLDLLRLRADLAQRENNFAGAETFYTELARLNPDDTIAAALGANCAANLGRRDEAIAALEGILISKPGDPTAFSFLLELALGDRGLAATIALLEQEIARSKTRPIVPTERLRQKALSLFDAEDIRKADPRDVLGLRADDGRAYTLRAIYEAIEPIGANCEIGFVQRKHGAEPLSLFRWTSISVRTLLSLLINDLEGYEDPANYSLRGAHEREYQLYESRYETTSHTGVNSLDLPPDEFLARVVRKQTFLKRKFLEDVAKGAKIFTYAADRQVTDTEIANLDAQLVRLGIKRRLFVLLSSNPEEHGTVRPLSDGCLIGFRSSPIPDIQFAQWDRIAVAAYDQFGMSAA